jgi:putative transcription factor
MMCEICGSRAPKLRKVIVEGSTMSVCPDCFSTLTKKIPVESGFARDMGGTPVKRKETVKPVVRKTVEKNKTMEPVSETESIELVVNYRELIRKRRRELGWSEEDLGNKTGLRASLVKKVESGKITPSIPDTRKIENVLKIKLLKPRALQEEAAPSKHLVKKPYSSITLGEVLREEASEQP